MPWSIIVDSLVPAQQLRVPTLQILTQLVKTRGRRWKVLLIIHVPGTCDDLQFIVRGIHALAWVDFRLAINISLLKCGPKAQG